MNIRTGTLPLIALIVVSAAASVQAQSCNTEFCIVDLNSTIWLNNNTWGQDGTDGWSESVTRNSNTAWRTDFVWPSGPNPNGVKAYPSAVFGWHWGWHFPSGSSGLPTQLSANLNVNSSYGYSATFGSGGTGNVAYDIWLHTQSNPLYENPSDEIMIWVNNTNAGPISQQPVINNISIGGSTWTLHRGNIGWNVWSFVRNGNSGSGSINVKDFTDYLRNNQGLSASKYLTSVQFGSEIFHGTGNVNVTNYTCAVGSAGGGTTYYKFRNVATSLYIDGNGSTTNGANCLQYTNGSSTNQQWERVASGGFVRLKNRTTGLFVDGMGRNTNGSDCGQWSDSNSNNQQWTESTVSGNYKFQNRGTGLFLDGIGRTGNGSILGQWASSTSNNQRFARVAP